MLGSSCFVMPSSSPRARPTSSKSVGIVPTLLPICMPTSTASTFPAVSSDPPDREAVDALASATLPGGQVKRCGLMPSRAQFALQHFARGRHGQLRTELDETWILVVGHVLFRPGHQFDFCDGRTILNDNKRFDLFPVTIVRHTDDGCQAHCRMRHQHLFDLAWVDVEAAANNHILHSVDDVEVAIFVAPPNIAGMEPAMAHRFGGCIGALVITLHYVVSPNSDLPHFAGGHVLVVRIDQAHLDSPYGKTDRAGPGFAVQTIENGNRASFGEAIPLQDFDVELLVKGPHHLHRHGRSSRDSNAQVAGDFL